MRRAGVLLILLLLMNLLYRYFSSFIPKASLSPLHNHLVLTLQTFFTPKVEITAISDYKFSDPPFTLAPISSFILHSLTISPSTSSAAAGAPHSSESSHHINSSWLLGPVAKNSPKIAVAKPHFLVFTSQTIYVLIYKHKKNLIKIKR